MIVNERATKAARAVHARGVSRLWDMFGVDQLKLDSAGVQTGRWRPWRKHPNTPPVRTAVMRRRHAARKAQRAARKRNRSHA